jgi:hypothetical protein
MSPAEEQKPDTYDFTKSIKGAWHWTTRDRRNKSAAYEDIGVKMPTSGQPQTQRYSLYGIKSFRHAGFEKFYKTGCKAEIQPHHATKLEEQLTALNCAKSADDIMKPASWRLHGLQGKEKQ